VSLRSTVLFALIVATSGIGCSSAVRQPPGAPPSPKSVTLENPGGDADDPQAAALKRQLEMPWRWAMDKDGQVNVPMVDADNYKRVRYWAIDHFTGFRYGDDYHVMNVVLVQDIPEGAVMDSRQCMSQAEKWGRPQLKNFEVKLGNPEVHESQWRGQPIVVKSLDGYLDFGFERRKFSAAWAAYPAYPDACLVFGVAVPWGKHPELAAQVRDRWVKEAVPRIQARTKTKPHRI
jgi:hypothetical protein